MSQTITLTTNRLRLRPTTRFWSCALLASGGIVAWFLAQRGPDLVREVERLIPTLQALGPNSLSDSALVHVVAVGVTALFALFAGVFVLYAAVVGLRNIFRMLPTTGIPGDLSEAHTSIRELFRNRAIHYERHADSLSLAESVVERFRYLTRPQRALLGTLGRSIALWTLLVAVLSIPVLVPSAQLREVPALAAAAQSWPLPVPVALVGVFAIGAVTLAAFTSLRRMPRIAVSEQRIEVDSGGNPVDMFLQVRRTLEDIRLADFPNREVLMHRPNMGRSREGETDSFNGEIIIERQPEPMSRGLAINAMILDVAGAALTCAGYGAALFGLMGSSLGAPPDNLSAGMLMIAALAALRSGRWCRNTGYLLHHVFRFGSDLYWLVIEGTYSVGHSGLGDGRGGQVYVQRAHVQSRSHVHLYATRIVSECVDLAGERIIVDCRPDAAFQDRLTHLVKTLDELEGAAERLPSVDLTDRGLREIVAANAQIEQMQATARHSAQRQLSGGNQPQLPKPAAAESEMMPCPECAEPIRVGAKKCRFCNARLGDPGAAPSGDSAGSASAG